MPINSCTLWRDSETDAERETRRMRENIRLIQKIERVRQIKSEIYRVQQIEKASIIVCVYTCEGKFVVPQWGEGIRQGCEDPLHGAKHGGQSQVEEHEEEQCWPEGTGRKQIHSLCKGNKRQSSPLHALTVWDRWRVRFLPYGIMAKLFIHNLWVLCSWHPPSCSCWCCNHWETADDHAPHTTVYISPQIQTGPPLYWWEKGVE